MDIAGEVANIHMRTDAKKLVTTARTTHLLKQKEAIHMISMLRKEVCSGNIHDLAHIPTQHCLAECLSKASAKADDLITAVKTGNIYAHKGEGYFIPECPENLSGSVLSIVLK